MAKQTSKDALPIEKREWGFDHIIGIYLDKVDSVPAGKRRTYAGVAVLVGVALLLVAILAPVPSIVDAFLAFPAAIISFGLIKAYSHLRTDESKETLKERKSFAQRVRLALYMGGFTVLVLLLVGRYIPYELGGVLMITVALCLYDFVRRTPEEIALAEAGLIDSRDLTPEQLAIAEGDLVEDEEEVLDDSIFEGEGESR